MKSLNEDICLGKMNFTNLDTTFLCYNAIDRMDRNFYIVFLLLISCSVFHVTDAFAQQVSLKTNVLYWATSTPNVGVEVRLGTHYTTSLSMGYNAFNFNNREQNGVWVNPKIHHWVVTPEFKYWFCRAFERHFVEVEGLYGRYNAGGMRFPSFLSKHRYKGSAVGVGVGYGYQWALGRRWGLEASLALGYVYLQYNKYELGKCGADLGKYKRHYFGPTKLSISFAYYIH